MSVIFYLFINIIDILDINNMLLHFEVEIVGHILLKFELIIEMR